MKRIALTALLALPLMPSPAQAVTAACTSQAVSVYIAAGFSCFIDGITFSNFSVNTVGNVALGNIGPATTAPDGEVGLSINYTSSATNTSPNADVTWNFRATVTDGGPLINDVFAQLIGTITGSGTATLGEGVTDAITGATLASISLTQPNTSATQSFTPTGSVNLNKDQQNGVDFTGITGSAMTSEVTNAFSRVPGPVVGMGLPGLVAALLGFVGYRRKRRVA
jgi:hypothetical protein